MNVSIGILCYNEKDTIERIVDAVHSAPLESRDHVVDDKRPTLIIIDPTRNQK